MLELARNPSRELVRAFDAYFFPIVHRYVLRRRAELARIAGIALPDAPGSTERLEESAHMTAIVACNRARASAADFDPAKGSAEAWVLRAAAFAYREVVLQLAGARRRLKVVPTDDEHLHAAVDQARTAPDPFRIASARAQLAEGFATLTDDEKLAVLLHYRDGHTYAQTAEIMFGDPSATKRVDRLLQAATLKLRAVASNYQDDEVS